MMYKLYYVWGLIQYSISKTLPKKYSRQNYNLKTKLQFGTKTHFGTKITIWY